MHQKNLECLAKEIYKLLHGSPVMSSIFKVMSGVFICNPRNFQSLYSTSKKTVKFVTETINYRGPQIWNLIPNNIKNIFPLENFSREIKKWNGGKCPWRICKTYLQKQRLATQTIRTSSSV